MSARHVFLLDHSAGMGSLNLGTSPALRLFPAIVPLDPPSVEKAGSVAVVMRTKNRPLLLHRALSSVLSQVYQKWHLYLVNDGGNADTLADLVAQYVSAFGDRLTVIQHAESQGMENASNAALARAEEEFVVIHDDDDSWHPDFLEETTMFLADPVNRHCVGVTTGCRLVTEQIVDDQVEELGSSEWIFNRSLTDFSAILGGNTFPPICFLFRRAAVERIGLFNGSLPVLGDWEFNIRALMVGEIDFLCRNLANYHHRVRGGGASYCNTVVDSVQVHEKQNILLRNSILRAAISESPGLIAVMQSQALLRSRLLDSLEHLGRDVRERVGAEDFGRTAAALDAGIRRLDQRLDQMEAILMEVHVVTSWHRKMLRPVHWLWDRLLPARRLIASARGSR
jgi:glycosyltransferase involved in cell wall biosynthesis